MLAQVVVGIQVGIEFHGWFRVSFYILLSVAESVTRYFWFLKLRPCGFGCNSIIRGTFSKLFFSFFRKSNKICAVTSFMQICFGPKCHFEAKHQGGNVKTNQSCVSVCKYKKN